MAGTVGLSRGTPLSRSVHVTQLRRSAREARGSAGANAARSSRMASPVLPWRRELNSLLHEHPEVAVIASEGILSKLCAAMVSHKKQNVSFMRASFDAILHDDQRDLSNEVFNTLTQIGFRFGTLSVVFHPGQKPRKFTFIGEDRVMKKFKPKQRIWFLNRGVGKLAT